MTDADNSVLIYGVEDFAKTTIFLWPNVETVLWNFTFAVKNSVKTLKWSDVYDL